MRVRRATTRTDTCRITPTEMTKGRHRAGPLFTLASFSPRAARLATRPRHYWSQRATPQVPVLVPKVKVPASRLTVLFAWPVARVGTLIPVEMTYWDVPSSVRAQAGETVRVGAVRSEEHTSELQSP